MHKSAWIKWQSENKCPCLIPLTMVDWVLKSIRLIVWCDRCVEKDTLLAKLNDSRRSLKSTVSEMWGLSMWILKSPVSISSPWLDRMFPSKIFAKVSVNCRTLWVGVSINNVEIKGFIPEFYMNIHILQSGWLVSVCDIVNFHGWLINKGNPSS